MSTSNVNCIPTLSFDLYSLPSGNWQLCKRERSVCTATWEVNQWIPLRTNAKIRKVCFVGRMSKLRSSLQADSVGRWEERDLQIQRSPILILALTGVDVCGESSEVHSRHLRRCGFSERIATPFWGFRARLQVVSSNHKTHTNDLV